MIIGIRSALICKEIKHSPDGALSLVNIINSKLTASTRPAYLEFVVSLVFDTDGQPSEGVVLIAQGELKIPYPVSLPKNYPMTSAGFPVEIPIMKPAPLVVTIVDDTRPEQPWRYEWGVEFAKDARPLKGEALSEVHKLHALLLNDLKPH